MKTIRTALVVDDDPLVRETICVTLLSHGIKPMEATDGRDALIVADQRGFDLVISDLFMPTMDGLELIPELRRRLPTAKIILTTGGGNFFPINGGRIQHLEDTARFLGAALVLRKPFRPRDLLEAIRVLEDAEGTTATDTSAISSTR